MLLIQLQYMLPTNNNNIKEFYYDENICKITFNKFKKHIKKACIDDGYASTCGEINIKQYIEIIYYKKNNDGYNNCINIIEDYQKN